MTRPPNNPGAGEASLLPSQSSPPPAGTVAYLVRHGETEWNASGRFQGRIDVPLNAVGERQAWRLADRLRREGFSPSVVVSSDLSRAARTAEIVGEALGVAPRTEPGFREIDVGAWEGLTREEVAARDPEVWARIHQGEDLPRGGAERMTDLRARVGTAFGRLVALHPGGRLLLVTHGGSTRALVQHLFPERLLPGFPPLHVGNASLTVVAVEEGAWRVRLLDDRAHLAEGGGAVDGAVVELQ